MPMYKKPKEGELYASVSVYGKPFELYYGYYEEFERNSQWAEPVPIYPDLRACPLYTDEGHPIVTQMQIACPHYGGPCEEDSCGHCPYFQKAELLFGKCTHGKRKLSVIQKQNTV